LNLSGSKMRKFNIVSPELCEGIGQGVSGGKFYSERFSNLPQRLKDPEVQKEIIWVLKNLTEVH
jgi:hypothetical protein